MTKETKETWALLKKAVINRKSSEECDDTQLLEKIEDVKILRAYIKCMWDAFENMEIDEHNIRDIETTLEERVEKMNKIEAKYCDYIADSMDLDWFD